MQNPLVISVTLVKNDKLQVAQYTLRNRTNVPVNEFLALCRLERMRIKYGRTSILHQVIKTQLPLALLRMVGKEINTRLTYEERAINSQITNERPT